MKEIHPPTGKLSLCSKSSDSHTHLSCSPFRSGPVYHTCCVSVVSWQNVTQTFTSDLVSTLLFQFLIVSIFCYLITCQPACETLAHFSALAAQVTHGHSSNALAPARVHDSRKSVQSTVLENKNIYFKVNVQALQESKKTQFLKKCGNCVVTCEGVCLFAWIFSVSSSQRLLKNPMKGNKKRLGKSMIYKKHVTQMSAEASAP